MEDGAWEIKIIVLILNLLKRSKIMSINAIIKYSS